MSKNILFRGQTRKKGEKVTMSGTPIPSNWVFGGIHYGKKTVWKNPDFEN